MPVLQAGALLWLGPEAGVQFRIRPIWFEVVRVMDDWPTSWAGTVWIDGFELDEQGRRVERRRVFVDEQGALPAKLSRIARAQRIAAQGVRR